MNIFLDDIRTPRNPEEWTICRTAQEAIEYIRTGQVGHISFDHDLGTELNGNDVAKEIEKLVAEGKINCPNWSVHSGNTVGAANIEATMEAASRIYMNRTL